MKAFSIRKKDKRILVLRVIFLLFSIATVCFIFSNSLKERAESSAQSSQVVDLIQDVASAIAPDSPIATATGEDYDNLHAIVRKLAHFSEFALLGASLCGTYFTFSDRKKGLFFPLVGVGAIACIDECLQLFVQGRGASVADVALDTFGGGCGILFALLLYILIRKILRTRSVKNNGAGKHGNRIDCI